MICFEINFKIVNFNKEKNKIKKSLIMDFDVK